MFGLKKYEEQLNDSMDRLEIKIHNLVEENQRLKNEKEELIVALKGLQKSLENVSRAWCPDSPYGVAVNLLEKHNRYWE